MRLVFESELLNADELMAKLKLVPNRSWNRGDFVAGTQLREKFNGVSLETRLDADADIGEELNTLLDRAASVVPQIAKIAEFVDIGVSCVIYGTNTGGMHLSACGVRRMVAMGASFDIEFYAM